MDIKSRIRQLKVVHWLVLALVATSVITALSGLPEKEGKGSYQKIIYPPNLATIILIDSPEYRALIEAKQEKIVSVCYQLGPFLEEEDVERVKHKVAGYEFDIRRKVDREKRIAGYWVYLDPERSRALGRLKVEEVKLKGLSDVVLLTQNNPRYAISLGFFKDKAFAGRRLLKAQSLGLDAKMDVRYKNQDYQWLLIQTSVKNDLSQKEWLKVLRGYQNIQLKTINCG